MAGRCERPKRLEILLRFKPPYVGRHRSSRGPSSLIASSLWQAGAGASLLRPDFNVCFVMDGAPDPSQLWARLKYEDDDPSTGEIVEWHPLCAHSVDVAAATEALPQRTILRDRLASLIGWDTLSDVHVARLSALAALHDAGKVNHGFQEQAFSKSGHSPGHVQPIINVLSTPPLQENSFFHSVWSR